MPPQNNTRYITMYITDERPVPVSSNAEVHHAKIDIIPQPAMRSDELASFMMMGYVQAAEAFLKNHDQRCTGCPAFRMHSAILAGARQIHYLTVGKPL